MRYSSRFNVIFFGYIWWWSGILLDYYSCSLGTLGDARNWTQVFCMQSKYATCCAIALALWINFLYGYLVFLAPFINEVIFTLFHVPSFFVKKFIVQGKWPSPPRTEAESGVCLVTAQKCCQVSDSYHQGQRQRSTVTLLNFMAAHFV